MADIPIRCAVASAIVLEDGLDQPRMLLLRRAKHPLLGEWCHVAGGIEDGETAWKTALREIHEETGLAVVRLFSADCNEPVLRGRPKHLYRRAGVRRLCRRVTDRPLELRAFRVRWVTIAEAQSLVTFGGQRRVYEEIQREFIDRKPSPWHKIAIAG